MQALRTPHMRKYAPDMREKAALHTPLMREVIHRICVENSQNSQAIVEIPLSN
jgi:hypothetical protein